MISKIVTDSFGRPKGSQIVANTWIITQLVTTYIDSFLKKLKPFELKQLQQSAEEVPGAGQHSDAFPKKRRLNNFILFHY